MDTKLIELVRRAGIATVERTLDEGRYCRVYNKNVTGSLAINAKARGFGCARAGGLEDLWTAISRYTEEQIRAALTEAAYIEAHKNVLIAVGDCTKYITEGLARQVEALEARIGEERVEELKRIAEREA